MARHVLLHELGHALGLVGEGVPMLRDHMDHAHPGHSASPDSVMYYRVPMNTQQVVSGDLSDHFDSDDLADLAAARAHPDGLFIQRLPWEHA
jgi:hypothetical protein